VYEWGPENGRKMLWVHGLTILCLAVGAVAQGMVERGYRVMIFVRHLILQFPQYSNRF
jgi:hypothetical protein